MYGEYAWAAGYLLYPSTPCSTRAGRLISSPVFGRFRTRNLRYYCSLRTNRGRAPDLPIVHARMVPTGAALAQKPPVLQPDLAGNWERSLVVWTCVRRHHDLRGCHQAASKEGLPEIPVVTRISGEKGRRHFFDFKKRNSESTDTSEGHNAGTYGNLP